MNVFGLLLVCNIFIQAPGMVLVPGNFSHQRSKLEARQIRETIVTIPIPLEVLLGGDMAPEIYEFVKQEPKLSKAIEDGIPPSSLLKILGDLKEEYVNKADDENKDNVRSSFDKVIATLKALSNGGGRTHPRPAEILDMLSEEESDNEQMEFDDEYYDETYSDEEEDEDPSLLDLIPSWNRKMGKEFWPWVS